MVSNAKSHAVLPGRRVECYRPLPPWRTEKAMPDNIPTSVQLLCDRSEIERLAYILARGNDIDKNAFDDCMCDDVEVIYSFGRWHGVEEHKKRCTEMCSQFTFIQ